MANIQQLAYSSQGEIKCDADYGWADVLTCGSQDSKREDAELLEFRIRSWAVWKALEAMRRSRHQKNELNHASWSNKHTWTCKQEDASINTGDRISRPQLCPLCMKGPPSPDRSMSSLPTLPSRVDRIRDAVICVSGIIWVCYKPNPQG